MDHSTLATNEAISLFLERARGAGAAVEINTAAIAAVAEICRAVDGLPLAIELAAARITVLSVVQLRDRLVDRLALLVRHGDDGRHASMRRTIADTWDQLGAALQRCLAGCTIFAGGFTLESAEEVVDLKGAEVLDAVGALRDRSLVTTEAGAGGTRFNLLASIRAFAAARRSASPWR